MDLLESSANGTNCTCTPPCNCPPVSITVNINHYGSDKLPRVDVISPNSQTVKVNEVKGGGPAGRPPTYPDPTKDDHSIKPHEGVTGLKDGVAGPDTSNRDVILDSNGNRLLPGLGVV